jgi:hypothetical protein
MRHPELLKPKELAAVLRRNVKFVYAMKARGFAMPGGTATVEEARVWLLENPNPRSRKSSRVSTGPNGSEN